MTNVVTSPVLLTTADVARELGLPEIDARRLIALRVLPATRVGDDWRILPRQLEGAMKAIGETPRLQEFDYELGWFDNSLNWVARCFEEALQAAMLKRSPNATAATNYLLTHDSLTHDVQHTDEIANLMEQPVPQQLVHPEALQRFVKWRDVYAVTQWRDLVATEIMRKRSGKSTAEVLFETPETFATITTAAYEKAKQRRMSTGYFVSLPSENGCAPVQKRVSLLYPLSHVFNLAARLPLSRLAF